MGLDAFGVMNVVGLLAFAVVGSLRAIDADLDLLGVGVLGIMTALGGGITRDLLVNSVPVALQSTTDVSVALAGVAVGIGLSRLGDDLTDHSLVLLPDAVGLSAFVTTGALVATDAGLLAFGVVVLATVTGVGGELVSDVLLQRVYRPSSWRTSTPRARWSAASSSGRRRPSGSATGRAPRSAP